LANKESINISEFIII